MFIQIYTGITMSKPTKLNVWMVLLLSALHTAIVWIFFTFLLLVLWVGLENLQQLKELIDGVLRQVGYI